MDGTVGVGHSGVEVGQGINTKVAQCVAHELGIPLDLIAIDPTTSFVATNADPTGGSITSGLNRFATLSLSLCVCVCACVCVCVCACVGVGVSARACAWFRAWVLTEASAARS
jgi:hypothetical protein